MSKRASRRHTQSAAIMGAVSRLVRVARIGEIPVGRGKSPRGRGRPASPCSTWAVASTGRCRARALTRGTARRRRPPRGPRRVPVARLRLRRPHRRVRRRARPVRGGLSRFGSPIPTCSSSCPDCGPCAAVVLPIGHRARRRRWAPPMEPGPGSAARHRVSTEDAYVEGAVVVISARVPGPVAKVLVRDNETVREGPALSVEIDPRDSQIRVAQASRRCRHGDRARQAGRTPRFRWPARAPRAGSSRPGPTLAAAPGRRRRRPRGRGRGAGPRAQPWPPPPPPRRPTWPSPSRRPTGRASISSAAPRLAAGGLIAQQELDAIRTAQSLGGRHAGRRPATAAPRRSATRKGPRAETRRRALSVQQAERRVDETRGPGGRRRVPADPGPGQGRLPPDARERASSRRRRSWPPRSSSSRRPAFVAPSAGMVSKKTVEPGQMVQVGQPLLAIVPLEGVWVIANLKETQVGRVRVRPACDDPGGHASRPPVQRPRGLHQRGDGRSLQPAAARERVGQLGEGGPASAGQDPARRLPREPAPLAGRHVGAGHDRRPVSRRSRSRRES